MITRKIRKYSLRVLYPSSNRYQDKQERFIDIYANDVNYEGNSLKFINYAKGGGYELIASYPQNYTIIEEITVIKDETKDETFVAI